jgi:two-component system LytT family response regulator
MTETMRVLVAEDELLARKRLLRLLAAMEGVTVIGACEDGVAVVERVKAGDVDVVLLDVQMPGLTGLEAVDLFEGAGPVVVLCTAHSDHAVDAFEKGAVDYVMKPVEAGRLKKALGRARERLAARTAPPARPASSAPGPLVASPLASGSLGPLMRLPIPTRQGIVLLDPRTVSHATLDGELVTVVADGGTYLSLASLAELQEALPRELFERVHRRALVNLEHVARLEPTPAGGFLAHTRGGHAIEVSRQAARELRRRLGIR